MQSWGQQPRGWGGQANKEEHGDRGREGRGDAATQAEEQPPVTWEDEERAERSDSISRRKGS